LNCPMTKAAHNIISKKMEYIIHKASVTPSLKGQWDGDAWQQANIATLDNFLKESSDHHPRAEVKLTYLDKNLYVFFRVFDKYVLCKQTQYQAQVCKDSCVEFFVQPRQKKGYFNFEINCGGTMLLYYIEDPTRVDKGFARHRPVPLKLGCTVDIYHSLPRIVYPEVEDDTKWLLEYRVPFTLFEAYLGSLGNIAGQIWRGNLFKCADSSSHPHWASWASLDGNSNFHLPEYFAPMRFE